MKISLLLFFLSFLFLNVGQDSNNIKHDSFVIYIFNTEIYGIDQTNEEEFWVESDKFDTILFLDKSLANYYFSKLSIIKDTMLFQPEEVDQFDHSFVFIFRSKFKEPDTIYSGRRLRYFRFKNHNKFGVDTTGFFKRHFSSFYLMNE